MKKERKTDAKNKFSKQDLFAAFQHYAFTSISNQPYCEEELIEQFDKWFKNRFQSKKLKHI